MPKATAEIPIHPGDENTKFHPSVVKSLIGQTAADGSVVVDAKWRSPDEVILIVEFDVPEELTPLILGEKQ